MPAEQTRKEALAAVRADRDKATKRTPVVSVASVGTEIMRERDPDGHSSSLYSVQATLRLSDGREVPHRIRRGNLRGLEAHLAHVQVGMAVRGLWYEERGSQEGILVFAPFSPGATGL